MHRLAKSVHSSPRTASPEFILDMLAQIRATKELGATIPPQWILGHSDIPGNEAADQCAKEAAENMENIDRPPISLETTYSVIDQKIKDAQPCHERTR